MAKLKVLAKRFDILDANDDSCQFGINIDVLNEAFGVGRSMYARAVYPDRKGVYFTDNNPKKNSIYGCLNYMVIALNGRTALVKMATRLKRPLDLLDTQTGHLM